MVMATDAAREELLLAEEIEELERKADTDRLERELARSGDPLRQAGDGIPMEMHDPMELVTVYNSLTGEPLKVPNWTVLGKNSIMRRRRILDDGTSIREFLSSPPPGVTYTRGSTLCLLHPRHPRRGEIDAMGLQGKFCDPFGGRHAEHLASHFAMEVHMRTKHRSEWQAITAAETKYREDEYRVQQAIIARAAAAQMGVDYDAELAKQHGVTAPAMTVQERTIVIPAEALMAEMPAEAVEEVLKIPARRRPPGLPAEIDVDADGIPQGS